MVVPLDVVEIKKRKGIITREPRYIVKQYSKPWRGLFPGETPSAGGASPTGTGGHLLSNPATLLPCNIAAVIRCVPARAEEKLPHHHGNILTSKTKA
jgi:hypothetical protein